jgi:hypothetical protein
MTDSERLIHEKLDKLTDAVSRLVLIEDRQAAQYERMDKQDQRIEELEREVTKVDRKVDTWIQRGVGAWAFAASLLALWEAYNLRWHP